MQKNPNDLVIFLIVVSALIAFLVAFIAFMFVTYRRRQDRFQQDIEEIKLNHEKTLLRTQLEMQEQTFQNISREIHDNINLSLTLAKLNLNTIDLQDITNSRTKIGNSVDLLTKSIGELSNISKGLNADVIFQQGLTKAIEAELGRIRQLGKITIEYSLSGNPIYLNSQKELIIFRIIQEAFNNILKHAEALVVRLVLHYDEASLFVRISDNGKGFDLKARISEGKAGLHNMDNRIKMLSGSMEIETEIGKGTILDFTIPFETYEKQ